MDQSTLLELLRFSTKRDITKLYKDFLGVLEELKQERQLSRDKLEVSIPEQYQILLDAAFPFNPSEQAFLRKRILDLGNDAIRNQIELIDKVESFLEEPKIN